MKQQAAVVAVLVLVLVLGAVPGSGAIHKSGISSVGPDPIGGSTSEGTTNCNARTQDTIRVGAGSASNGQAVLHGITYVDAHFPACSSGRFSIEGDVLTEPHCSDGFLRVYGPLGVVGESFIITWKPHEDGSC